MLLPIIFVSDNN